MSNDLKQYLRDKQALVDGHLRKALMLAGDCPPSLMEAMEYSLLAPGKRLRPILTILAAEACNGTDQQALAAGCAAEMVHAYSLIHDDLPAMDDDDLRRGQPTCHKKFGEALAILAGDALLTLAFQVLAESYPPTVAAACCKELARGAGAAGMVGGQVLDLAWETGKSDRAAELKDLENIHACKTGALFRAALRMGFWTAQVDAAKPADPANLDRLDRYGRGFGQIFQITDDLLDVESSAEETGKRVNKDAGRGKLTYPGFMGVDASRKLASQLCQEACAAIAPLGSGGERLQALIRWVLERKQ